MADAAQPGKQRYAVPNAWFEAVLGLLPFPVFLIEQGSEKLCFQNYAAATVPLEPRLTPSGVEMLYASDMAGKPIAVERMPHRRAARGETIAGEEVTWLTSAGQQTFLVYANIAPRYGDQQPLSVLTYLDITRLKQTEQQLRQAVTERDQFFSVATHELKDPLFSLQLSVQLLLYHAGREATVPSTTLNEQLEVCNRQLKRLTQLVENLLDVSRISNSRVELDLEAFDLCELLHEVICRFQEHARALGSDLRAEPCGSIVGQWDRMKIDQVISNLISNAIKYGDAKPIIVRLSADDEHALLEVEDHGIGIAAEDLGRVFNRFERAASNHKHGSLGLGLFIVRSIVEAHGGKVDVCSEPGSGSVFRAQLPRSHGRALYRSEG